MKFKTYYIKHTKDFWGDDEYSIYKKYFGLFSVKFREYQLVEGFHNRGYKKIYRTHYIYYSLEKAKSILENYLNEPAIVKYKGHILKKCHDSSGDMWVDYSVCIYSYYGNEYEIFGCLRNCQMAIDRYEEGNTNKKFKEIIEV